MAYNPPIGSIYHLYILYTTYILPSGGLYATYHLLDLLGEPETTIDLGENRLQGPTDHPMKGCTLPARWSPYK